MNYARAEWRVTAAALQRIVDEPGAGGGRVSLLYEPRSGEPIIDAVKRCRHLADRLGAAVTLSFNERSIHVEPDADIAQIFRKFLETT